MHMISFCGFFNEAATKTSFFPNFQKVEEEQNSYSIDTKPKSFRV